MEFGRSRPASRSVHCAPGLQLARRPRWFTFRYDARAAAADPYGTAHGTHAGPGPWGHQAPKAAGHRSCRPEASRAAGARDLPPRSSQQPRGAGVKAVDGRKRLERNGTSPLFPQVVLAFSECVLLRHVPVFQRAFRDRHYGTGGAGSSLTAPNARRATMSCTRRCSPRAGETAIGPREDGAHAHALAGRSLPHPPRHLTFTSTQTSQRRYPAEMRRTGKHDCGHRRRSRDCFRLNGP
jgi:hypothetical protein